MLQGGEAGDIILLLKTNNHTAALCFFISPGQFFFFFFFSPILKMNHSFSEKHALRLRKPVVNVGQICESFSGKVCPLLLFLLCLSQNIVFQHFLNKMF